MKPTRQNPIACKVHSSDGKVIRLTLNPDSTVLGLNRIQRFIIGFVQHGQDVFLIDQKNGYGCIAYLTDNALAQYAEGGILMGNLCFDSHFKIDHK